MVDTSLSMAFPVLPRPPGFAKGDAPALVRRIRSHGWKTAIVAGLSTMLIAGSAQAYRPFDLTDADVAKRHIFEIELGPAEFVGVDSDHSLRAPNLSINFGLGKGRELTLEGANHVALERTPGEPRMQLEDVAIAMKQVLRRGSLQDESGPSIAMEAETLFPERGENHLGAAASLIASSAGKRGTAHFNVEAARLPESRNAGSAGLIFEAKEEFGLAPAFEVMVEAADGAPPEYSAILGLIYVPGEKTEYDVALRFAQRGDEKIFELRSGLTWQFSGHRVLEKAAKAVGGQHPRRRRH